MTEHKNRAIGPQMLSALAYSILSQLDVFGDINSIQSLQDMYISNKQTEIENEFEHHYYHFCAACIGAPENKNFSGPLKELLIWHWKLGASM